MLYRYPIDITSGCEQIRPHLLRRRGPGTLVYLPVFLQISYGIYIYILYTYICIYTYIICKWYDIYIYIYVYIYIYDTYSKDIVWIYWVDLSAGLKNLFCFGNFPAWEGHGNPTHWPSCAHKTGQNFQPTGQAALTSTHWLVNSASALCMS